MSNSARTRRPSSSSNLGDAYYRRGAFDKAVGCFKRALRFNPDLLSAKEQLLRVKAVRDRLERAEAPESTR